MHDYEQERDGRINFRGHGVFTYDPTEKRHVLHWWDSMGVPPNVFKGSFDGNTLQMLCRDSQGHSRTTWEFLDANRYRFRMEMSQDGQQWMTLMEGDYTVKSPAAVADDHRFRIIDFNGRLQGSGLFENR